MISKIGKNKGFTFIELLFVITIFCILIGISLPRFRPAFNTLQLNTVSGQLQSYMNYLSGRAVIEGEIVYLNIDSNENKYWASIKEGAEKLKTYSIPAGISLETEQKKVAFYPNGTIDKLTIRVINTNKQEIALTTKGVFSGVKLQAQK
jgi:prepilin-type N-terminal cleavage/methylation domain-containing protein